MNRCNTCKLDIATPARRCPLCGGALHRSDALLGGAPLEQTFPAVGYSRSNARTIQRVGRGLLALLSGVLLLDLVFRTRSLLVVAATLGCCYLGASLLYTLKSRQSVGFALLRTVVVTSLVTVVLDYATGFSQWSTTYVIPFLVLAASFTVTSILLIRPQWFREYFVYQVSLWILCLLTALLRVFRLVRENWPVDIALTATLVTIGMLFFYYGRMSVLELRKRLHL